MNSGKGSLRSRSLGLCFATLALGLGGAGACVSRKATPASALRVQLSTEPASLDPTLAEDGASLAVLGNTMEGLVGYDGKGQFQSLVAESHEVSSDGKRYAFKLRPTARWSDGRSVTAEDFVTTFRRCLAPRSGSKLAGIFFGIRGARAYYAGKASSLEGVRAESGGLVIELEEPSPYFIQALTMPVALPLRKDVLDANEGRWPDSAPSNGPYRIRAHQADRWIRFELNPHYWKPAPAIPSVEMVILNDESTALNLFERGGPEGIDILTKVGASELPRMRKRPGVLITEPFLATYYLSFNFRKPPFNDRSWRQAVSSSIRREEIARAMDTGDLPATSFVPPGLEGHVPYAKPVGSNADAGSRKRGVPPGGATISAAFDTSSRNNLVMEKVQSDLKQSLGLRLTLNNSDWKSYLKTVQTDPPQIFRLGILAPFLDPIQILDSFTTGSPNNYLKWSNDDYDRTVAAVAALKPGPERVKRVREAQAILVDREAIVVPIFHYVQNHAVSARVEGFRANPFGVVKFAELKLK